MSTNKLFINFSVGFLLGVCVTNILFVLSFTLIFLSSFLFFLLLFLIKVKKIQVYILMFGLGISIGTLWSQWNNADIFQKENIVKNYAEKEVTLTGIIVSLQKQTIDRKSYITSFDFGNKTINGLLYFPSSTKISLGDKISFSAKLQLPKKINSFDYPKYLQTKNIYFIVYIQKYELLGIEEISYMKQSIFSLQKDIHAATSNLYPENHAALLGGLLFGEKNSFSDELMQNFNNSGLTHIVAVSGFNITIIIIFLGFLFGFLPPVIRSVLITLSVVFFTILVGYEAPVVRASIMGLIGYYILLSGRKGESLSLLLLAALMMTLYNPLLPVYDISFQLSFLAVIGLYYTQNFFQKIFYFIPKYISIKESLVLTMSALSTTLPIMIFHFGQVSIIAPISNILVGAIIPITMLVGFLSLLGQYFSQTLGFILGYGEYFLLEYILKVAEYLGNLKYATLKIDLGYYGGYFEIIYFGVLLFLILYFRQEKNPVKQDFHSPIQEK